MKTFRYKINDELGIHARPAGLLVKEAKKYASKIFVQKGAKKADVSKLIALMTMNVKKGDIVEVSAEGADEDIAFENIKHFFEDNF